MTKQIIKRIVNGVVQYFGTHSDAVQIGEKPNVDSLTNWMNGVNTSISQRYTKAEVDAKEAELLNRIKGKSTNSNAFTDPFVQLPSVESLASDDTFEAQMQALNGLARALVSDADQGSGNGYKTGYYRTNISGLPVFMNLYVMSYSARLFVETVEAPRLVVVNGSLRIDWTTSAYESMIGRYQRCSYVVNDTLYFTEWERVSLRESDISMIKKIRITDFDVETLMGGVIPSAVMEKLAEFRSAYQKGDIVMIPEGRGDATCVLATVTSRGSQFNMYFYYDNKIVYVTGSPSNNFSVTKETIVTQKELKTMPYKSVITDGVIPPKGYGTFATNKKSYSNGFVTVAINNGTYLELDQAAAYGQSFVVAVKAASSGDIDDALIFTPANGYLIKRILINAKASTSVYPFFVRFQDEASVKTINTNGDYLSKTFANGANSATLLISSGAAADANNKWLCMNMFVVEVIPAND